MKAGFFVNTMMMPMNMRWETSGMFVSVSIDPRMIRL